MVGVVSLAPGSRTGLFQVRSGLITELCQLYKLTTAGQTGRQLRRKTFVHCTPRHSTSSGKIRDQNTWWYIYNNSVVKSRTWYQQIYKMKTSSNYCLRRISLGRKYSCGAAGTPSSFIPNTGSASSTSTSLSLFLPSSCWNFKVSRILKLGKHN